jgi:hypothetical protein
MYILDYMYMDRFTESTYLYGRTGQSQRKLVVFVYWQTYQSLGSQRELLYYCKKHKSRLEFSACLEVEYLAVLRSQVLCWHHVLASPAFMISVAVPWI